MCQCVERVQLVDYITFHELICQNVECTLISEPINIPLFYSNAVQGPRKEIMTWTLILVLRLTILLFVPSVVRETCVTVMDVEIQVLLDYIVILCFILLIYLKTKAFHGPKSLSFICGTIFKIRHVNCRLFSLWFKMFDS